jgi:hypothetical protein
MRLKAHLPGCPYEEPRSVKWQDNDLIVIESAGAAAITLKAPGKEMTAQ